VPQGVKVDADVEQAIVDAHSLVLSDPEIADKVGVSKSVVKRVREEYGLERHWGSFHKPLSDAAKRTVDVQSSTEAAIEAAAPRRVKKEPKPVKKPKPVAVAPALDLPPEALANLAANPSLLKALCVQLACLAPDPLPFVNAARALAPVFAAEEK
jgi:hypothetical protein